jgi:hypothetical protein
MRQYTVKMNNDMHFFRVQIFKYFHFMFPFFFHFFQIIQVLVLIVW